MSSKFVSFFLWCKRGLEGLQQHPTRPQPATPPARPHRMRRYPSSVWPSSWSSGEPVAPLRAFALLELPPAAEALLPDLAEPSLARSVALGSRGSPSGHTSTTASGDAVPLPLRPGSRKRRAACPASSSAAAEASSGSSEGLSVPPRSQRARASARAASEPSSCPSVAPAPSSPNRRPACSGLNTSAERAHRDDTVRMFSRLTWRKNAARTAACAPVSRAAPGTSCGACCCSCCSCAAGGPAAVYSSTKAGKGKGGGGGG